MDCDPGIDDAVALACAAASRDSLQICGISTVAGNQTSERVTNNALKLASFLDMEDVPVVRGARGPLVRTVIAPSDHIHGKTGLGDCELPQTAKELASDNGLLFLRDTILALPERENITLVPTGPLTNIALLLKTFPEVRPRIEQIVLMGGSSIGGNRTASAEFNIWVDPEAAKIVFDSGLPIVMCGLDITRQCGLTREQIGTLSVGDTPKMRAYGEMLQFYCDSIVYAGHEIISIHDAATILYLTHPELFAGIRLSVDVDCTDSINRGMTVCDKRGGLEPEQANVLLLDRIDEIGVQDVIMEKLCEEE